MAEEETLKSPPTLSKLCLDSFLKGYKRENIILKENVRKIPLDDLRPPSMKVSWKLEFMPTALVADILYEMAKVPQLSKILLLELTNLRVVDYLLRQERTANKLIMCFELVGPFCANYARELPYNFGAHCVHILARRKSYTDLVKFGLRLGSLVTETGWMIEGIQILTNVLKKISIMRQGDDKDTLTLVGLQTRLHCETMIWDFAAGKRTLRKILEILNKGDYKHRVSSSLFVETCTRASAFELARHKYKEAHKFSVYAMQNLNESMPKRILVDALRTTAKACMAIQDYETACTLIKQALSIAENVFGRIHLKFADVLFDYAHFLLIYDKAERAVKAYGEVFQIRIGKLDDNCLLMCLSKVALANALYHRKYRALNIIYETLSVMSKMLPEKNLLLASAYRLRLLINDTISYDKYRRYYKVKKEKFKTFLKIHKETVKLCVKINGEMNLFTAQHYLELARIYQASKKYEESKKNVAKYISIIMSEKSPSEKDSKDLRVLESFLKQTNEERNILRYIQIDPWLLNRIESSDRVLEEESASGPRFYEGLRNLYPPKKYFHKHLTTLAAEQGWKSSSQESNDLWCIEYLKDTYFKKP